MEASEINHWVCVVLKAVLEGRIVSSDVEEAAGGLAVISADADRIKEYVFESMKLPEIRGASQIVRDLTEGDGTESLRGILRSHGLPAECVVYAGGGSMLAIVPRTIADGLCQEMGRVYASNTGAATLTAINLKSTSKALAESFSEQVKANGVMLRARKESRQVGPFFEISPLVRRCASCGARPASGCDPRKKVEIRYLCRVCIKKVGKSGLQGQAKLEYFRKFEDQIKSEDFYLLGRPQGGKDLRGAHDLSEISRADRESLVALIYADGDGVGKQLSALKTLKEYSGKSRDLSFVMNCVVNRALAHWLKPVKPEKSEQPQDDIHPFEIITIGGDDVLVIVPAGAALPVALEICDGFTKGLRDRGWQDAPGMSAGVVIAHSDNPIRFLRDLAEQLLKSAKKRAHREKVSCVDFAVLKSQSMVATNIEVVRDQAYSQTLGARERISITGKPFTLEELRRLLNEARLLEASAFPNSQSQMLRELIAEARRCGRLWPWLRYQRQKMRMKPIHRGVLRKIESDWMNRRANPQDLWPWLTSSPARNWSMYNAIWEDLHEVRGLLPKEEPPEVRQQIDAEVDGIIKNAAREEDRYEA
jgi:hypothetical protein